MQVEVGPVAQVVHEGALGQPLAPQEPQELLEAVIHRDQRGQSEDSDAAVRQRWTDLLGQVRFGLPEPARPYARTFRSAAAHILINRNGSALQPGPRRYTRSWIRDGAGMATALLRLGLAEPARDFIRWYATFQAADGNVPCCVDSKGLDWLPEHDSHGQLVFAVAEYIRLAGDLDLARELWPACLKAVAYLEQLRARRLTDVYRSPDRLACYGLLPESVSHEGYLAHPRCTPNRQASRHDRAVRRHWRRRPNGEFCSGAGVAHLHSRRWVQRGRWCDRRQGPGD
jgi:hypothetical protein